MIDAIQKHLGNQASLLDYTCTGISKDQLHLPGPDFVDRVVAQTDRSTQVMGSLQRIFNTGRLAGTGFVSILPVDQGIEHSAGASFAPNPDYFDPERIVELAIEGGCNAVASTLGVLGSIARKYAHRIPFLVKLNHNELLSYPNRYDQIYFAQVEQAWRMGAVAVGATIYFGSAESHRQILETTQVRRRPGTVVRPLRVQAQVHVRSVPAGALARPRPVRGRSQLRVRLARVRRQHIERRALRDICDTDRVHTHEVQPPGPPARSLLRDTVRVHLFHRLVAADRLPEAR